MKTTIAECPFCGTVLKATTEEICPKCDFPLHGIKEEEDKFKSENEKLEHLITRADKALSWARFAMLWPWITAVLVAAYFLIRAPRLVSEMKLAFSLSVIISGIFISCYFIAPKKPVLTSAVAFGLLLLMTAYGLYQARMFLMFPKFWLEMLVPAIMLLMYGNALFLQAELEHVFKKRKKH